MNEVIEDLHHNIPIQAVDLLLDADMIDSLADLKEVDQTNVWKICQYLLRIVYFHYEASEKEKIFNVCSFFLPITCRQYTNCSHVSTCGWTVSCVPSS